MKSRYVVDAKASTCASIVVYPVAPFTKLLGFVVLFETEIGVLIPQSTVLAPIASAIMVALEHNT